MSTARMSDSDSFILPFTAGQRRGLMVFCLLLVGLSLLGLFLKRAYVADPLPALGIGTRLFRTHSIPTRRM